MIIVSLYMMIDDASEAKKVSRDLPYAFWAVPSAITSLKLPDIITIDIASCRGIVD